MSKPRTVMETAATLLVTAAALVVAGTPALFVNGRRLGARAFGEFQEIAEKLGLDPRMSPPE